MTEWINVNDKLPSQDEPVWIFWRNEEVVIGWRTLSQPVGIPHEHWYSYHGGDKERWTYFWMPIDLKNKPQRPKN